MGQPRPLFLFIFVLHYYIKTVGFRAIWTRIVGVEGEHADHLTTTTAHQIRILQISFIIIEKFVTQNVRFDVRSGASSQSRVKIKLFPFPIKKDDKNKSLERQFRKLMASTGFELRSPKWKVTVLTRMPTPAWYNLKGGRKIESKVGPNQIFTFWYRLMGSNTTLQKWCKNPIWEKLRSLKLGRY